MNRADNSVIIECELETKSFDKQIEEVESKLENIDKLLKEADLGYEVGDVKKLELEYERLNNKLFDLVKKRNELTKKGYFETFNEGLTSVTKKVAKWGMALFGIRTAYNFIRSSVSMLTQDNEQLATDIKFIQYALAQTIKPIVEFLIRAVYKLIGLINAIYTKIFGTSLFTKEMVDGFNKANKSANKLRKTLAGFDEMNVLNDNGTVGVAGSIVTPNLDDATKEMDNWMEETSKKFYNFGDEIAEALSNPEAFSKAFGVWDTFVYGITQMFGGLYQLVRGTIDAISGAFLTIYGLFTGDIDLMKEGIKTFVKSIGETINGIINVIKGAGNTIAGILKPIFAGIWNGLKKGAIDAYNGVKGAFSPLAGYFKTIFTNAWNGVKQVFSTGGEIYKGIKEGVTSAFKTIVNKLIDGINVFIGAPFRAINNMLNKIKNASILGVKPFYWMWGENPINIPKIPKLAKGGIINMPGKGVPIAMGGEQRQEGVIPLTDSQQMALLGEAIGRYININATIPVYVGNRQIAREMQKIQNLNDFAMNR